MYWVCMCFCGVLFKLRIGVGGRRGGWDGNSEEEGDEGEKEKRGMKPERLWRTWDLGGEYVYKRAKNVKCGFALCGADDGAAVLHR